MGPATPGSSPRGRELPRRPPSAGWSPPRPPGAAGVPPPPPPPEGPSSAGFLPSRPGAAEETAIGRLVPAARDPGARVHVVHLPAADALPLRRRARAEGVRITAETCPH